MDCQLMKKVSMQKKIQYKDFLISDIHKNKEMTNLTFEKFYNHKLDKIYFQENIFGSKITLYVMKMYKIVKLFNNEEFLLYFTEFFIIFEEQILILI